MLLKRFSLFIFCSALLSCSQPAKEEKAELPALPPKALASETDTFYGNQSLIRITDTTKTAFEALFSLAKTDTSEIHQLNANKDHVQRKGDTLVFLLANGGVKKLVSSHCVEGMDSFWEYKYLGFFANINYHVLYVGKYEAFSYLMINAANGKETELWGMPEVSPDNKCVAASCFDLQAGFVYNGMQLFDVTADSLKPRWSRELGKWGADNIAWLDNSHLIAEKMQLDSSQNVMTSYIKISVQGK